METIMQTLMESDQPGQMPTMTLYRFYMYEAFISILGLLGVLVAFIMNRRHKFEGVSIYFVILVTLYFLLGTFVNLWNWRAPYTYLVILTVIQILAVRIQVLAAIPFLFWKWQKPNSKCATFGGGCLVGLNFVFFSILSFFYWARGGAYCRYYFDCPSLNVMVKAFEVERVACYILSYLGIIWLRAKLARNECSAIGCGWLTEKHFTILFVFKGLLLWSFFMRYLQNLSAAVV